MELIPILSTIILVATISTFLLAIGAYILYKTRERKSEEEIVQQPPTVKAELVTPYEAPVGKPVYEQPVYGRQPIYSGIDWRGEKISGRQYQPEYTPKPRPYGQQDKSSEDQQNLRRRSGRPYQENKFMKYTSEGYVSPDQDKDSGAPKWR